MHRAGCGCTSTTGALPCSTDSSGRLGRRTTFSTAPTASAMSTSTARAAPGFVTAPVRQSPSKTGSGNRTPHGQLASSRCRPCGRGRTATCGLPTIGAASSATSATAGSTPPTCPTPSTLPSRRAAVFTPFRRTSSRRASIFSRRPGRRASSSTRSRRAGSGWPSRRTGGFLLPENGPTASPTSKTARGRACQSTRPTSSRQGITRSPSTGRATSGTANISGGHRNGTASTGALRGWGRWTTTGWRAATGRATFGFRAATRSRTISRQRRRRST